MLKQRVITAIVLLAIIIAAYMVSEVAFAFVMGIGFTLALWEWLKLAGIASKASALVSAVVGTTMMSTTYLIYCEVASGTINEAAYSSLFTGFALYLIAVTLLWLGISIRIFMARHTGLKISSVVVAVTGILFVPAAWLSFVSAMAAFGIAMVVSILCVVWIADIMAYFTGMAFGKRRLAPALSPKKSWEGVIGGMVSVILAGFAAAYGLADATLSSVFINVTGPLGWCIGAVVLVALSIVGDLFESTLKRQAGIKDSSNLLPGHGGFYDRLDAMMPTLPAAFVCVMVLSLVGSMTA